MLPTEKQIKDIAEELDSGFLCYFNLKTGKIINIPDMDMDDSEGLFAEEIKEVEKHFKDFFKFEQIESSESYRIMENYASSVEDPNIQERLLEALVRPKPFWNFKYELEKFPECRKNWFNYKNTRHIQWVKNLIEAYKDEFSKFS